MFTKSTEKFLSILVIIAGPLVGLFVTPSVSTDPVNQPKMLILTCIAFAGASLLLLSTKSAIIALNCIFGRLSGLFVLQLILVFIFAPAPKSQQFFGVFGRNTGLLTYLCLILISICAFQIANQRNLEFVALALIFTGVISAIYSGMQTLGADPIKWSNPYNPITAFLGNPNFQSSFLGISAVATFGFFLKKKEKFVIRIISLVYIFSAIGLIIRSNSQQGILVLGAGILIVFSFFLIGTHRFARKIVLYPYFILSSLVASIVIAGTLNHGPMAETLYKLSVRQRGYYWHSAIEMIKSHPFFGVGLDSYGDWYFATRSKNAAFNTPQTGSNAAHNVFLDLGAFGGLPLFLINLALVSLTIWSIIKVIQRKEEFNWAYAALVGAWVGYVAQSIISINQIGLAVWGWILMGIIVGYERCYKKTPISISKGKKTRNYQSQIGRQVISCLGGGILGIALVLPLFNADSAYRKAVSTRNGDELLRAAQAKPTDTYRLIQSAIVFADSNLLEQANMLIDMAIEHNPRSYDAWRLKELLTDKTTQEYQDIVSRLNILNPNVPAVK